MEGVFMKWEGGLRGLTGWAVMLAVLVGGVMLAYALVCLSLAVYLWFDPIVWRVFIVFGSLGVFGYVGHLAWEIFEDSLMFPFVLSAVGLAIIALGILYARNREHIERGLLSRVPEAFKRLLPKQHIAEREG
jgi:hypothetical protein